MNEPITATKNGTVLIGTVAVGSLIDDGDEWLFCPCESTWGGGWQAHELREFARLIEERKESCEATELAV